MTWISNQFELSRHGEALNVRPMEGLRGFAVFLVFLVHYVTSMAPWIKKGSSLEEVSLSIHTIGNAGVDLFFVLSGYLIYGSLIARRQGFIPFLRRRVARIYPAFCVVFALYLLLSFTHPAESKIPHGGLAAATYVLENFLLLPGLFRIEPMITVAWSLSYEMFYYLAIPLTISLVRLRDRSARFRVWFFLGVAFTGAACFIATGGPARLLMFIAGILLYEALRDGLIPTPRSSVALFSLAAGLLATTIPLTGGAGILKVLALFGAFFVLCYSCFRQPTSWLAQAFSQTSLRWLGNMSYSYYLLHGLTLKAIFTVLRAWMPQVEYEWLYFVGAMPIIFILTLFPAATLYLAIERPFSLNSAPTRPASNRRPPLMAVDFSKARRHATHTAMPQPDGRCSNVAGERVNLKEQGLE